MPARSGGLDADRGALARVLKTEHQPLQELRPGQPIAGLRPAPALSCPKRRSPAYRRTPTWRWSQARRTPSWSTTVRRCRRRCWLHGGGNQAAAEIGETAGRHGASSNGMATPPPSRRSRGADLLFAALIRDIIARRARGVAAALVTSPAIDLGLAGNRPSCSRLGDTARPRRWPTIEARRGSRPEIPTGDVRACGCGADPAGRW